jgi:hypothetical protein
MQLYDSGVLRHLEEQLRFAGGAESAAA